MVIDNYHDYVCSFVRIADERIDAYVRARLDEGELWPEPLLQLNPAYPRTHSVRDLVEEGMLHPACADIFADRTGAPFTLYHHQEEAIRLAGRREPYVLTTGTGSGKSLTYFVPIVDAILKDRPDRHSVRAIIVYPMNALINSQLTSIRSLLENRPGCPVRVARYTGQESREEKEAIRQDPPHILLTNYVMLELMLTRPYERVFVGQAVADLQFLVLDELHTYTGRRGADVAMLVRRLRERCGNPHLLCVGTSATMAAGGSREEQRRAVAEVAGKLFGVPIAPQNVIDETLTPIARGPVPDAAALRAAIADGLPPPDYDTFVAHPVTAWIERTFGVETEGGTLRRRTPISLSEGARRLAEETGLEVDACRAYLEGTLRLGSRVPGPDGESLFAFKLHQFISQGGAVYASLEPPRRRYLTLSGQVYAWGTDGDRLLLPLLFCRECGQEYYEATLTPEGALPALPGASLDQAEGEEVGYLLIEDPDAPVWSEERIAELPENWFTASGQSIQKRYRPYLPRRVWLNPDGTRSEGQGGTPAWFVPRPLLFCPACGVVYTRREREFRKLTRLSSEGRSTATTLLALSTVAELRRQAEVPAEARVVDQVYS